MSNEDFAKNPNTPAPALAMLSTSPSETVRLLVASNPNTPVAALRHLALDESKEVRQAVARNPKTPYDAFTAKEVSETPAVASDDQIRDAVLGEKEKAQQPVTAPIAPQPEPVSQAVQAPNVARPSAPPARVPEKKNWWQRLLQAFGIGK